MPSLPPLSLQVKPIPRQMGAISVPAVAPKFAASSIVTKGPVRLLFDTNLAKARGYWHHETALQAHEDEQFEDAEKHYHQALGLYKKVFGPEHSYTAAVLYNLGDLQHTLTRHEEAEKNYLRARAIEIKALGEGDPRTIQTMQNIASLYHDMKRPDDAEKFYLKILSLQERSASVNMAALATTHGDLAAFYHDQGRSAEAKKAYEKAISLFKSAQNNVQDAEEIERLSENLQNLERLMGLK